MNRFLSACLLMLIISGFCMGQSPLKHAYTLLDEEKFEDKGVEIIGISLDNDIDKLTDYIAKENLTWKMAYSGKAWDDPDAQSYGVNSIPSIWVVDKKGILRNFDVRGEELVQLVNQLVQEK